ncbi:hypothetical protein BCR37DRAFT_393239 [Protomyces lactucae-debilis]|uniref:Myb/SANT-like domain-containing protein n=1 Tax=Protomyces lactucae-debilis TaxID=2754530 RepID=A0A1Y2FD65_PROLT|nr:uncharacterized protein BCR37DRAFT_393239 [Protomyces lactucae-debilis]ORY81364.1 hypothetical protein BCR37DRAFT_393239 [Protomyces lactucae-debilis]
MAKKAAGTQTRLVGNDYRHLVRPKTITSSKPATAGSFKRKQDLKITGFFSQPTAADGAGQGQKTSTTATRLRGKRKAEQTRIQVQDSMTGSECAKVAQIAQVQQANQAAVAIEQKDALSDAFSRLMSPSKRRKLDIDCSLPVVPDSQASPVSCTQLDTEDGHMATPHTAHLMEIPSSVAYERYHDRLLTEPDTPTRPQTRSSLPSPPYSLNETETGLAIPETQMLSPSRPVMANLCSLQTPPKTTLRQVYQDPEDVSPPSGQRPSSVCIQPDGVLNELPATLVVTSQARRARRALLAAEETASIDTVLDERRFEQLLKAKQALDAFESVSETGSVLEDEKLEVPDSEASDLDELECQQNSEAGERQGMYGLLPESLVNDSLLVASFQPPSFGSMSRTYTQAQGLHQEEEEEEDEDEEEETTDRISASPSPRKRHPSPGGSSNTNNNNNNNNDGAGTQHPPTPPQQQGDPSMSGAGAEGDLQRAYWTPEREELLAEICKDLKKTGHSLPGSYGFSREAWQVCHRRFVEAAGVEWSIAQLKARYQRLRMDYEAFKLLKDAVINEGGVWNEEQLLLEASEEVKQIVTAANKKDRVYFNVRFSLYPTMVQLFDREWDRQTHRWVPRGNPAAQQVVEQPGANPNALLVLTETQERRRRHRSRDRSRRAGRNASLVSATRDPLEAILGPHTGIVPPPPPPAAAAAAAAAPQSRMQPPAVDPVVNNNSGRSGPVMTQADLAADHAQLTRAFIEANKTMLQSTLKELSNLTHPRQVQLALHRFTQHAATKQIPVRTQILCKEVLTMDSNAEVWLTLPVDQYRTYFDMKFRQRGVDQGYTE